MNTVWSEHLIAQGAVTDDASTVPEFAADGGAGDNILVSLSSAVVLGVSGNDARSFLQGQFSNDVAALADPGAQLTTWSSPKGRVVTLFSLTRIGDDYRMRLPADLTAAVLKRLRMYVLRADVSINPLDNHVCIGVAGDAAAAQLTQLAGALPAQPGDVVLHGPSSIARVRGDSPRFEVIGPVDDVIELWSQLATVCRCAAESDWQLQEIAAGVPSISAATSEAFVLQMLNLQLIDGVSFKKGCFPGQEVVARMQYLGKLKKRMYRARVSATQVPGAGTDIFRASGGSAVGKVVSAARSADGSVQMLAVLAIDASADDLHCDGLPNHRIDILDLPYQVDAA